MRQGAGADGSSAWLDHRRSSGGSSSGGSNSGGGGGSSNGGGGGSGNISGSGALSAGAGDASANPTTAAASFVVGGGAAYAVDRAYAHMLAKAVASRTETAAIGWKVGGPDMHHVCGCSVAALLKWARTAHAARMIYLYRSDSVAVAVSLELARRSRVYVRRAGAGMRRGVPSPPQLAAVTSPLPPPGGTALASPRVLVDVRDLSRRSKWYQRHLAEFGRAVDGAVGGSSRESTLLVLQYEELLQAPQEGLRRVFRFLGLRACDVAMERATTRLGGRSLRDHVANWHELCQELVRHGLRTSIVLRSCDGIGLNGTATQASGGSHGIFAASPTPFFQRAQI